MNILLPFKTKNSYIIQRLLKPYWIRSKWNEMNDDFAYGTGFCMYECEFWQICTYLWVKAYEKQLLVTVAGYGWLVVLTLVYFAFDDNRLLPLVTYSLRCHLFKITHITRYSIGGSSFGMSHSFQKVFVSDQRKNRVVKFRVSRLISGMSRLLLKETHLEWKK